LTSDKEYSPIPQGKKEYVAPLKKFKKGGAIIQAGSPSETQGGMGGEKKRQ